MTLRTRGPELNLSLTYTQLPNRLNMSIEIPNNSCLHMTAGCCVVCHSRGHLFSSARGMLTIRRVEWHTNDTQSQVNNASRMSSTD